jgi:3-oxoadipate enol-lactonase
MDTFAQDYRVVRCDMRGFGDLPATPGPYSNTEDVLALLDELDIDRVALVGNSQGGRVAVDVCQAAPDRVWALVLVAAGRAGWSWSDGVRQAWAEMEEVWQSGDMDRCVDLTLALWLDGPDRAPGTVGGELRARVAELSRHTLEMELAAEAIEAGPERRPEGSPADVRAPALVVAGEHDVPDILAIADAYEREIPGARRVVMPGVAHVPSMEAPEAFDRLVLDFLASAR